MKNYKFWTRDYVKLSILFKYEIDDKGNRCGYIDENEAISHGFTSKQWSKFYARCKAYMLDFLKNGYCEAFPINVIYCEETRKYYLADGQGRIGGMKLAIKLNRDLPFNEVPVQTFSTDTLKNVHDFIREINTKKMVCMSSSDMNDIDARVEGGEVEEVRNEVINYRDNIIKVDADYVPELMFFGCKCSHSKHDKDFHYDRSKLRKYHDTYCEQYAYFLNNVGKRAIELNVMSKERVEKLIRKQSLAILMDSYYRLIERTSEKYGLDVNEKITEATQRIVKFWNNGNRLKGTSFTEAMNTDKGAKAEFAKHFELFGITMHVFKEIADVYNEDLTNAFWAWTTHAYDKYKKAI